MRKNLLKLGSLAIVFTFAVVVLAACWGNNDTFSITIHAESDARVAFNFWNHATERDAEENAVVIADVDFDEDTEVWLTWVNNSALTALLADGTATHTYALAVTVNGTAVAQNEKLVLTENLVVRATVSSVARPSPLGFFGATAIGSEDDEEWFANAVTVNSFNNVTNTVTITVETQIARIDVDFAAWLNANDVDALYSEFAFAARVFVAEMADDANWISMNVHAYDVATNDQQGPQTMFVRENGPATLMVDAPAAGEARTLQFRVTADDEATPVVFTLVINRAAAPAVED